MPTIVPITIPVFSVGDVSEEDRSSEESTPGRMQITVNSLSKMTAYFLITFWILVPSFTLTMTITAMKIISPAS